MSERFEERVRALGLSQDRLISQAHVSMEQELSNTSSKYIQDLVRQAMSVEIPSNQTRAKVALALFDRLLDSSEPVDGEPDDSSLASLLLLRSETFAHQISAGLISFLRDLVDDPESRVDGAHHAAEQAHALVHDLMSSVAREKIDVRAELSELRLNLESEQTEAAKKLGFRLDRARKVSLTKPSKPTGKPSSA